VSLLLFYTYVEPLWSEQRQKQAIKLCLELGARLQLGGRIRVAREGFNTTLSGTAGSVRAFAAALREWDEAAFAATDFKVGCPLHLLVLRSLTTLLCSFVVRRQRACRASLCRA